MDVVGSVLRDMMRTGLAYRPDGSAVKAGGILRDESVVQVQRLIAEHTPRESLEVGMAMGMSTLAILYALDAAGGGTHVAIDPYESAAPPTGYEGIGVAMVRRARLDAMLTVMEEPSYLALPALVAQGRRFDFILIDGYHTFDYTFVDYFYADLLLRDGGLLVFDDVMLPMVHHVCWFLETHKAYERLGPRIGHPLHPLVRLRRRLYHGTRGGDPVWGGIQVYRKVRTTLTRPLFHATPFYPYFRLWRAVKRLRVLLGGRPDFHPRTPY